MLTGKLVRLRARDKADLDDYLAWINDPEVKLFLGGPARYPFSRAEEEEWLASAIRQTKPPNVSLAIETLAESRLIGSIGLHGVGAEDRKATLGIMIGAKDCWNQGYGTDAILTLLHFGFDEMNLHRVGLTVHDDNARAIACYRKCGLSRRAVCGTTATKAAPTTTRSSWASSRTSSKRCTGTSHQ